MVDAAAAAAAGFTLRAVPGLHLGPPDVRMPDSLTALRRAYAAAVAANPALADDTLRTIGFRLQQVPATHSPKALSVQRRSLLLRAFLEMPEWTSPALWAYAGLPNYESLWQMRRPLVRAGWLTTCGRYTRLTEAGQAWLRELTVERAGSP